MVVEHYDKKTTSTDICLPKSSQVTLLGPVEHPESFVVQFSQGWEGFGFEERLMRDFSPEQEVFQASLSQIVQEAFEEVILAQENVKAEAAALFGPRATRRCGTMQWSLRKKELGCK